MSNRLATNELQQMIWKWEGVAFGNTLPLLPKIAKNCQKLPKIAIF
jgi:hypothetical protein